MTEDSLPKGFNCGECSTFHRFSAWVYAHWDIRITASCQLCGSVNHIEAGEVVETEVMP